MKKFAAVIALLALGASRNRAQDLTAANMVLTAAAIADQDFNALESYAKKTEKFEMLRAGAVGKNLTIDDKDLSNDVYIPTFEEFFAIGRFDYPSKSTAYDGTEEIKFKPNRDRSAQPSSFNVNPKKGGIIEVMNNLEGEVYIDPASGAINRYDARLSKTVQGKALTVWETTINYRQKNIGGKWVPWKVSIVVNFKVEFAKIKFKDEHSRYLTEFSDWQFKPPAP